MSAVAPVPHTYCHYCGAAHTVTDWPRACTTCGQRQWRNPLGVAVCVVPVEDDGLLVVHRAAESPGWALPGGYIDWGETAELACSRELKEETGLVIPADDFRLLHDRITPSGAFLQLFCIADVGISRAQLAAAQPDGVEVDKVGVMDMSATSITPDDLVFSLHGDAARAHFQRIQR